MASEIASESSAVRLISLAILLEWLAVSMTIGQADNPSAFLESPVNVTAALGEGPVTFTCHLRGDSLFWRINGTLLNYATFAGLRRRGISADVISDIPSGEHKEILSVKVSQQNNFTRVVCQRTVFGQISNFTQPVYLIIAGNPHPPPLQSSVLHLDTLLITWSRPFTWDRHPITEYSITIETADSNLADNNTVLVNTTLSPSTFSYNVSSEEVPVCTELAVTMTASSSIGRSDPQVIMAALPDGPGEFLEVPNIAVRFTSNHIPHLQLNFTLPYLCPYSDAMYTLLLRYDNGTLARSFGPYSQNWMDGGELIRSLLVDDSIVANMVYSLTVNVSNDISFTTTSITVDTSLQTPTSLPPAEIGSTIIKVTDTTETPPQIYTTGPPPGTDVHMGREGSNTMGNTLHRNKDYAMEIAAALAGIMGVVLLAIAVATAVICCIACRRKIIKRKRACIGTVEHRPMVRNPIYEAGAIYDEIPANFPPPIPPDRDESYVTIAANTKETGNLQMYEECKSMDDTYLPMQSAGTVNEPSHRQQQQQHQQQQQQHVSDPNTTRAAIYNNATPTSNGGRTNGMARQHQSPETTLEDTEERYIIVVH